ncbi:MULTISPECIES: DUF3285 domain-containing protein [unclassified Nodosilinea]|uniref:DUF3285 domain-containing protein n=1 Tax=Leptolyngbya subtilissima DQ-A4 TaxID=2933933 RepID=A0ABV0JZJ7_9CYAN|nr:MULTISPECIES: DUF3285 domain-containing protein [unclassified Nodosilinea]MBD2109975.1 DUF3285 domain-containing protein [Nodosilinea sp. FACHB-13]MBD2112524.1 DUF3285 domain-containing protein [Nodosilinea sp. FACHB-141]
MSQEQPTLDPTATPQPSPTASTEAPPSFVKLAMRNMVKKGGKSLFHFSLTVTALLTLLVGLAYLTR